jgi:hypothetical protein
MATSKIIKQVLFINNDPEKIEVMHYIDIAQHKKVILDDVLTNSKEDPSESKVFKVLADKYAPGIENPPPNCLITVFLYKEEDDISNSGGTEMFPNKGTSLYPLSGLPQIVCVGWVDEDTSSVTDLAGI